jgi:osmotically-inducible protein OsmY
MENASVNVVKEIYQALEKDPRTRKTVIEVGYDRGIVMLTGSVKNAAEYQAVEEVVRNIPGVITVTNELHVG